ncbi:hypothetical protein J1N35_039438 [Gossypium stocksii]|uniref:Uncharacterized protein n=1 Tax=Gossypium stocksii TaxID=47602 RepID=A0A9D3UPN3_9ROSI|nr:hypothetical protein J1N35_039438 [Gossypium stocksii]
MDNDKQDEILMQYEHTQSLDFDYLMETADDLGIDSNFEVTDQDMEDPEIDATLKSLGWTEYSSPIKDVTIQSAPVKREALLNEIISLKREALSQKRAGNVAEAMAQLKKAKLLAKDLESFDSQPENWTIDQNITAPHTVDISKKLVTFVDKNVNAMKGVDLKPASKSRLTFRKSF